MEVHPNPVSHVSSTDSQNQSHLYSPCFKTIEELLQTTIHQLDYLPTVVHSDAYLATFGETIYESQTFQEAMDSPDAKLWIEAMQREYKSLIDNQTWKLIPLPKG
jgi:hypothetical protein